MNTPLINKIIEWLLYKLPTYGAYICSNELLRLTIGYIMKKIRFKGKYMINISKNSFSDTTIIILKSFKLGNHIVWIVSNEAHFMGYLKGKKYWQEVILADLTDWLKNCQNMPVIIPTKICFFFRSAKIHSCQIDPFEVLSSTNQFKYFVFFFLWDHLFENWLLLASAKINYC